MPLEYHYIMNAQQPTDSQRLVTLCGDEEDFSAMENTENYTTEDAVKDSQVYLIQKYLHHDSN